MRIASSLAAFIFIGVATAGVVPAIGGIGGNDASVSSVHLLPSGVPSSASLHAIPSGTPSHLPASRRGEANFPAAPSGHPISFAAAPSGSHLPSGTPSHAIPSVSGQPHGPASRRAEPTGGHSGIPSGTPIRPSASAGSYARSDSVIPSVIPSHKPSLPAGSAIPSKPSTPVA